MTDLFTIPESKSPRLLWMERHGIEVKKSRIPAGHGVPEYWAYWASPTRSEACGGSSEDDALTTLAKAIGIKLWNEE